MVGDDGLDTTPLGEETDALADDEDEAAPAEEEEDDEASLHRFKNLSDGFI